MRIQNTNPLCTYWALHILEYQQAFYNVIDVHGPAWSQKKETMRSIIALVRQRDYFVQAMRRTPGVSYSPALDHQPNFKASNFLTTLTCSTKSSDSDGDEEPNKSLSRRIEKLPKGVTVGSALQSWMGDGFPVHGGDVYHAINRLRKLGRNKRALEV